jgi:hypothetical protein
LIAPKAAMAAEESFAFAYQGQLAESGSPANGSYDMQFELLDEGGNIYTTLCATAIVVENGVFSVVLDPGPSYSFNAQQVNNLRISVRASTGLDCQESGDYTTLSPNQRIRPTPLATRAYAATFADVASNSNFAVSAGNANSLQGLPPSHFTDPANIVGTIPDSKLSYNVVRTDTTNLFQGINAFVQPIAIGTIPTTSDILRTQASQSRATFVSDFSGNGSVVTLENRTTGLSTNSYLGAINFGTQTSTPGQLGYVKGPQLWLDTMQFRVGGLASVAIDGSARMGLGTLSPQYRLHIASGSSGITPNGNTQLLIDTAGTHYISSLTTNNEETGVLFGRPAGGHAEAGIVYNNPGTRGGLQFRSGGNATRMTIDNAGTVNVPGTLTVGNLQTNTYNYPAPKTVYKPIGISAFRSVGGGGALTGLSAERLTGSGYSSLGTTLELPQGATITNITIYVFDNDAAGNLGITLSQTSFSGVWTSLRTATTGGAQLGYQAINMTPFSPYVVDNQNNMLNLEVVMAVLSPWSNALAIIGARVTYTINSPD